jgi:hypothetical protein
MSKGHSIAGMSTTRDRIDNDFYATPMESVIAILEKEKLSGTILEPACGDGAISSLISAIQPELKDCLCI